jgi:hypothetical protein
MGNTARWQPKWTSQRGLHNGKLNPAKQTLAEISDMHGGWMQARSELVGI